MDLFGTAHGWRDGGDKKALFPKICHKYPTMTKLGTVIEDPKNNHVTHSLSSGGIRIFSPEISNFYYIKKYFHNFYFS